MEVGFYATAGPVTALSDEQRELIGGLGFDALDLCRVAQGLLVGPGDAFGSGLSDGRMAERNLRPASAILQRALDVDSSLRMDGTRPAEQRVVGTCRHFAVLATAFLRAVGTPARARCGFAACFEPPKKVDHWIVEIWSGEERRWVRVDPEHLDRPTPVPARCDDLQPGDFLTGGEAWQLVRSGRDDAESYGVFGTDHWGPGEIRGNTMRDLASVAAKVEVLPWDEWGPMTASYEGSTGDDFDALIDEVAAVTAADEPGSADLERVYRQLAAPPELQR
ncbi:MAG: transglutaminase-like domain-containing protein [Acidimicrobiales bacterium]